jgi:hypothetical protein
VATKTAEMAAWEVARGPPPSIRTAAIANSTTTAIEIAPVPSHRASVGDRDPQGDAESHLDGPAQPLVCRQPEGEHGGHRGEEGIGVAEQFGRDEPGRGGGDRGMGQGPSHGRQ